MTPTLAESYSYSTALARRTGKNFYYSFLTLPREQFRAMCALYAFMRETDDLADDASRSLPERTAALHAWRGELSRVCPATEPVAPGLLACRQAHGAPRISDDGSRVSTSGQLANHRVWPALRDVVSRYQIPPVLLQDVITGVEMDLQGGSFATFAELERYCYHVAGAVGLACIHIWGFEGDGAFAPAVACGTAFQLTNILRDLKEDALIGRCYLPEEHLRQFGYSPDDLLRQVQDERFVRLMEFEVSLARQYYRRAGALFAALAPPGQPILDIMLQIYGGILTRIEKRGYDVFTHRIRLSPACKFAIVARTHLKHVWKRYWRVGRTCCENPGPSSTPCP